MPRCSSADRDGDRQPSHFRHDVPPNTLVLSPFFGGPTLTLNHATVGNLWLLGTGKCTVKPELLPRSLGPLPLTASKPTNFWRVGSVTDDGGNVTTFR